MKCPTGRSLHHNAFTLIRQFLTKRVVSIRTHLTKASCPTAGPPARDAGRWARRVGTMRIGSVAPSSAKLTANSSPLEFGQLVAFTRELFEPPQQQRVTLGAPATAPDAA